MSKDVISPKFLRASYQLEMNISHPVHKQILFITQLAILIGIEAIFCFTPLGTIQIGPIAATLAMIPVIISSLLMGPKIGGILGFTAGLFSFTYWTIIDPSNPTAIMFTPFHTYTFVSNQKLSYQSYSNNLPLFLPLSAYLSS